MLARPAEAGFRPEFLPRHLLSVTDWDACIAASPQAILYGYSWYLDAVLPQPHWKWVGLVLPDKRGGYGAVMPVPLRKKLGVWQVHQPLFCQLLGVFSREPTVDPGLFYQAVYGRFRYGSVLHSSQCPSPAIPFQQLQQHSTHVLNLSVDYALIRQNYTPDRRRNLRGAEDYGWTIISSADPEPLLRLFQENHAAGINGGVGAWAYDMLCRLIFTLQERDLASLHYAVRNGQIEAGALFVKEGNRIIYLFNAASGLGRRGNARTLLIDQKIQEYAGRSQAGLPVWFDFESPEKPNIRAFYESFGAVPQPFWSVRWSRLTWPERLVLASLRRLPTY